jgi:hypothetical protein
VLRPRNQGQRAGELLVAATLDPNLAVGGPGALAVAFWQVNWERPGGGSAWPLNRTASAHFAGHCVPLPPAELRGESGRLR